MALTKVPNELSSTPSIVDGGNSTAITITSDEDLLVAKGSLDVATVGHELRASGYSAATRDGATVGSYTRLNSDGTILEFRKDSAAVGSIGTNSGYMVIGSPVGTDAHLLIGNGLIHPATSTGGGKDASIDLGGSSNRFKDIYLSGGAYLGGTGSANKLEDAETGNWSPTFHAYTGSLPSTFTASNAGTYTKVGRMVSVIGYLDVDSLSGASSNIINIRGLPFTAYTGNGYHSVGALTANSVNFARTTNVAITVFGTTELGFLTSNNNGGWGWEYFNTLNSSSAMRFEITYYTSQ